MKAKTKALKPKHLSLLLFFLCLATAGIYLQIMDHQFLDYDDNVYVTENEQVQQGITWEGVVWAFTTGQGGNWHPVTWLSHMLDCQLFGLNPAGHHLTSLLIHLASTVLLFLIFHRMTGAVWQSAFVAAIFALHPLHVESVAWTAERKDVLSGLFWMLTMAAYVRYVRTQTAIRYALLIILFALGLMSKPMLVTLPFALLLLDYWPLRRMNWKMAGKLIREKIPLFALVVASGIVTFLVQQRYGTVESIDRLSLSTRLANSILSYALYIRNAVWPEGLCVIYPYPDSFSAMHTVLIGAALVGVSFLALWKAKSFPFVMVGWFWYLGTLIPVIGLVQVGVQSMADRYMYIPLIGMAVIFAWGVDRLLRPLSNRRILLAVTGTVALVVLSIVTFFQIKHWKDSETLFTRALEVTSSNYVAHEGLGYANFRKGNLESAFVHYSAALKIKPNHAPAYLNMANALMSSGDTRAAIGYYHDAIRIKPDYAEAYNNLGVAQYRSGNVEEARTSIEQALGIDPNYADAHNSFGLVLFSQRDTAGALAEFRRALDLRPSQVDAHSNLGAVLFMVGDTLGAVQQYREALRLKPDHALAKQNLESALQHLPSR